MQPHNLPLTVIGAGAALVRLVRLQRGQRARRQRPRRHAFLTTNTAAAAAALGWMFTEWMLARQADRAGRRLGRGGGAGRHHAGGGLRDARWRRSSSAPWPASSATSACNLKSKLGYDDSLDVVGVHGVGGTWGAIATGIFATKAVNEAGGDGLLYGNPKQLWIQFIAVAVTWSSGSS